MTSSRLFRALILWMLSSAAVPLAAKEPFFSDGNSDGFVIEDSISSKTAVDQYGAKVGDVGVNEFGIRAGGGLDVAPDLELVAGASWRYDTFNITGPVPLPGNLEAVGVDVGVESRLSDAWTLSAGVVPGFAGESSDLGGSSFNLGGRIVAGYEASSTLSLMAGAAAEEHSQYRVLPVLGARWTPAPDWTVSVGFPRTAIIYRVSQTLRLNAGLHYQGGGYWIAAAPGPGLENTYLEYHEFRLGAGIDAAIASHFWLGLDLGAALRRKFDYYDRGVDFDGKSAGYLAGRASLRF